MKNFIRITVAEPSLAVKTYQLNDGSSLKIGRDPSNDMVVQDIGVSRFHAVFMATSKECIVSDLFSRNGTFINGNPIKRDVPVSPSDVVNIGSSKITVKFIEEDVNVSDGPLLSELTSQFAITKLLVSAFWLSSKTEQPSNKSISGKWDPTLRATLAQSGARAVSEQTECIIVAWNLGNVASLLDAINQTCAVGEDLNHQSVTWAMDAMDIQENGKQSLSFMGEPASQALRLQMIAKSTAVPMLFDKQAAAIFGKAGKVCKQVISIKLKGEQEASTLLTLDS